VCSDPVSISGCILDTSPIAVAHIDSGASKLENGDDTH
jgi:hypothetical protein